MSNGTICCIYGVCCKPPGGESAKVALAKEIAANVELGGGGTYKTRLYAPSLAVAHYILDTFDLVPKGLGAAIVAAYEPEFEKKPAKNH